ncbi:MAG: CoA ester lyase [Variovorax sp.]
MIARSLLFVPGDRPERFGKAAASGAHGVILDLEDAVAPDRKTAARDAVHAWLQAGSPAIVRINSLDTAWAHDDLRMLAAFPKAGLMVPKSDAASMQQAMERIGGATGSEREVIALIESVAGVVQVHPLAAIAGVTRLAFGNVDFAVDAGMEDTGDVMSSVRVQLVLASRYAGLQAPVDGVSLAIDDAQLTLAHARRSRSLGFGGKLCIHPRQVEHVNQAFSPTAEEVQWARSVLAAFDASGGAVVALAGKMIDRPVVERARRVLADVG